MAIKDLNNKKTGDKLYAREWNNVMNEILAHFSNKRIHLDMVITSDNELIYTDENNIRHQYVLQTKNKTWGEIYIYKVIINDHQIEYNEIPSSGILDANVEVLIQQYHNGEIEDISEFTLTYTDFEGNEHTLYDDSSFIISIPYNYTESEVDRSLNVKIEAHELVFEGLIPLIQLADEIDFYGNVNIISFTCEELNYEANSSVTPSLQYKQSITWKSGRTTNINSGLTVNYTLNTDDPNTNIDNTGQITKTTSNETYERISLGTLSVRVSGNDNKYDEEQINIYQASLAIPNLIYGQIPITDASELEEFVVNPENNINDTLIDSFNKVSNFTEGNLTIESTANDNEYVALCFLIKDINKNFYKVTTIPGLGDLHDEFSECGFNVDINYKDTYTYNNILYKLYISFFERINSNETNLYYIASNKRQ